MADRETIDTKNAKLYLRRDDRGRFKSGVGVGASLSADQKVKAKHTTRKGQGDRGDRKDA